MSVKPGSKRVLVVAAHSDDEVLGVGGTITRHILCDDSVTVAIAADCRTARPGHREPPALHPASIETSNILGTTLRFLGFPGMSLADGPELGLTCAVEAVIHEVKPDTVYTHHPSDPNSDHRAVAAAVMVATRPIGPEAPRRVFCFETPSSTEWCWQPTFAPNFFVDVTATFDKKLLAMACFTAELRPPPHPRGIEALRARAAYWGQVAGVTCAEPFVLVRGVW